MKSTRKITNKAPTNWMKYYNILVTSMGKFQVTSNKHGGNVYTTNANYEHTLIAEYMYSVHLKCLEKLKGRVLHMNTEKRVMSTHVRK